MAGAPAIQYTTVSHNVGTEPQTVNCPICGHDLLPNNEEGFWVDECPHVEFVFSSESGEFHFQTDRFEKRLAEVLEKHEDDDLYFESDSREILTLAGYDNRLRVIEVNYGGSPFNPGYTDYFGFYCEEG